MTHDADAILAEQVIERFDGRTRGKRAVAYHHVKFVGREALEKPFQLAFTVNQLDRFRIT